MHSKHAVLYESESLYFYSGYLKEYLNCFDVGFEHSDNLEEEGISVSAD